jgi:hypothetical protein
LSDQVEMPIDDIRLPPMVAVTTVTKRCINPGDPILNWAYDRGRKGGPLWDRSASDRGNITHGGMEDLHAGRRLRRSTVPSEQPFLDGLSDWYNRTEPRLRQVEVKVADRKLMVNGRIDYVRECTGCRTCRSALPVTGVILGDIKTGGLIPYEDAHVQVGGGYVYLYQHNAASTVVCGAEILAIAPNGQHKAHRAKGTPEMFLRALAWLRDLETLAA